MSATIVQFRKLVNNADLGNFVYDGGSPIIPPAGAFVTMNHGGRRWKVSSTPPEYDYVQRTPGVVDVRVDVFIE